MTASHHDIPQDTPTPRPWDDDEVSVRQALRLFASHVLSEMARHNGMVELELRGIHAALDRLEDRSEDTGRHLIITDQAVGRAEGKAEAALRSRRDSDPVRGFAVFVVTAVAKRVPIWLWPVLSAAGMLLAHKFGWLGK